MSKPRFKPYPAYKDSGVEWLGEIPAHWEVLAVRRLIGRIEQGWSPVAEDRLAGPDEWAVIKLSAVSKGRFVGDEHKALPADLASDRRYGASTTSGRSRERIWCSWSLTLPAHFRTATP